MPGNVLLAIIQIVLNLCQAIMVCHLLNDLVNISVKEKKYEIEF